MPRKIKLDIRCRQCQEYKTIEVENFPDREKFDKQVGKILKRKKWEPLRGDNNWGYCPQCAKERANG